MKKNIYIKTNTSKYHVKIGQNFFKKYLNNLANKNSKKYILIDLKVYKIYKNYFDHLTKKDVYLIKVNGSEKIKSIDVYWKVILNLLNYQIDRSSYIIAIGGGTVGDLGGFIASTILRGVKFILIPTTLLSQVDSSIGGKNGINTEFGKNLVGTFFQPNVIIVDTSFLRSLTLKQFKSGYAEIVKHAIISDKSFF